MSAPRPPRPAAALLRFLVGHGPDGDSIAGDLHEEYVAARARWSAVRSNVWYAVQTLRVGIRYARPLRTASGWLAGDLRHATRGLARDRGFSAAVVLTLALAIGAGTAIFSVVDGVVLRPLPFEDPDRLYRIWARDRESGRTGMDLLYSDLAPIRDGVTSFESVSMLSLAPRALLDERGENPEDVVVARTTPDLFGTLGIQPLIGRVYDEREARSGARLAVLSHELWQRRFGGDPDAIGRMVHLELRGFEIVGVLPRGVAYPFEADVWRALTPEEMEDDDREARVVARLAASASPVTAVAELDAVATSLAEERPETHADLGAGIEPVGRTIVRDVRTALFALLGAVGLVLLVACVNTANLLLSRATRRAHEVAIRTALGAARSRILSLHLTESLLLATTGGVAGIALGRWILSSMLAVSPEIPRLESVSLDARVVVVMAAVSALTGILFGVGPALHAASTPPERTLRDGARGSTTGGGRMRIQSVLVSTEVAVSTVLVVLSLLLASTFRSALTFDRGFPLDGLVSVAIDPMHPPEGADERRAYFGEVVERVSRIGGVRGASLSSHGILQTLGFRVPVAVEGRAVPVPTPEAYLNVASRGFFETVGIAVVEGTTFSETGGVRGDVELVVNERFASEHLDGSGRALGARVDVELVRGRVVGVVGDVSIVAGEPVPPKVYVSFDRVTLPAMSLTVRTGGDPAGLIPEIDREVRAVASDVLLEDARIVESEIRSSVAPQRFNMLLASSLALLSLAVAAVGIHGVTALSVANRRGEIGVRRALGASGDRVAREILRHVLELTAAGLALGTVAALAAGRLVAGLLVGVTPSEPRIFLAVAIVLGVTALLASVAPVARALRIDPRESLG